MRKYWQIYKATLMENMQYTSNILLGFISYMILLIIFLNLWDSIYSAPDSLIVGYTKTQMVWYVIITESIWFATSNRLLTHEVSRDIKSGGIAYGLNKPYHYMLYAISRYFGEITIKFLLYFGLGALFGTLFAGPLPGFKLWTLPFTAIILFFGILINALLRLCISSLAFWIEDSVPLHWIYDKLLLVVGTLFPIEIFPAWAQPLLRLSPIFVVTYGTAKLFIDFNLSIFFDVLLTQLIYLISAVLMLNLLYKKGVKKLNVNGG